MKNSEHVFEDGRVSSFDEHLLALEPSLRKYVEMIKVKSDGSSDTPPKSLANLKIGPNVVIKTKRLSEAECKVKNQKELTSPELGKHFNVGISTVKKAMAKIRHSENRSTSE